MKISQYSQETPVMKSLLNKVAGRKACKFLKMRPQHRCFPVNIAKFLMLSCEYCRISKNTYFEEHLRTADSEVTKGSDCLARSFCTVAFKTILT